MSPRDLGTDGCSCKATHGKQSGKRVACRRLRKVANLGRGSVSLLGPLHRALTLERRAEVMRIWHDGAWLRARLPTSVSAWSRPWTPGWHRVKRPVCLVSISVRSTAGGPGARRGESLAEKPRSGRPPKLPPLTTRVARRSCWPIRMPRLPEHAARLAAATGVASAPRI